MESAAALASPEAANQATDRDAQINTQKTNLTGRTSKDGTMSSPSVVSRNPFLEALVAVKENGELTTRGLKRREV